MNSPTRVPEIRELRNTWLCRVNEGAVRPEFCDLTVVNGKIGEVRPIDFRRYLSSGDPRERSEGVIDAAARVTTPPQINFHDHLYSRLAKGLALPGSMQDFRNILFLNAWNDAILAYARITPDRKNCIVVLVNLDPHHRQDASFEIPLWEFGLPDNAKIEAQDLLDD